MDLKLNPGWIQTSNELDGDYWFPNCLPEEPNPNLANVRRADGVEAFSAVKDAENGGGIGPIQWVNDLEGKAVVIVATGGWREGGTFRVFVSRCPGTMPVEITNRFYFGDSMKIMPGDNGNWETPLNKAMELVATQLGIAPLDQ